MRFRARTLARVVAGAVFALALLAVPGAAQAGQANVTPVQGLRFGQLIPGVTSHVGPGDVGRRGELQLEGRGSYQIQLVLPTALVSSDGSTLPVSFGAADAVLKRGTAGDPLVFDPNTGTTVAFTGGIVDAQLFLGGTALPRPDQPAGAYTANVSVLIARN